MDRGHGGHEYARHQIADTLVTYRRRRGNYFTTAVFSFFLGIVAVLMVGNSFLGITLTDIWDAKFTQKIGKMSQSERLIADGSVIGIARQVKPSIVNINSQQLVTNSLVKQNVDTVGSGIIIRGDGYILTNEHVVTNAKKVTVSIKKEKLIAQVVGVDKEHDIAVIKISHDHLLVPKFGSSHSLKVGELAVAIGSPFGLQRSVTAGVVSGVNRAVTVNDELEKAHTYTNLIQTDAAINPGNSGGALLNRQGEIVGMNSLIYSTSGVSQGVGFAIPIEIAKKIAMKIINRE